jgi:hypothetical protein
MRSIIFLLPTLLLLAQCQGKPAQTPTQKPVKWEELPQDFTAFYQKFHTDSAYQMAHIEWPLKGERAEVRADSTLVPQLHEWEPATWRLMHLPETSWSSLKRDFETFGNVMVIERMSYPMVGFGFERQFYKEEDGRWKLIYYAEKQMSQ